MNTKVTWVSSTGRKISLQTEGLDFDLYELDLPPSLKPTQFIKHIIYNGITTICIFFDDTKVISRPQKGERFDRETGVAMCIAKYIYGSRSKFQRAVESGHEQKERK